MDIKTSLTSFQALSQETRLKALRLLVRNEPQGLAAGDIARHLHVPHNTLSSHLALLTAAGWVSAKRQSRSIIYRANLEHMQQLIDFLVDDCCAGHPEICSPSSSRKHPPCTKDALTPKNNAEDGDLLHGGRKKP